MCGSYRLPLGSSTTLALLPFMAAAMRYKVSSRLKWWILMAAYRRGLLGRLPRVISIGISGYKDQTWDHMGWSAPEPPAPVIYIGTPGPSRKAVVGLIDTDECRVAAVAKIPLGANARRRTLREAEFLVLLEKEKPGFAPRSLFVDKKTGITVQEAIEGAPANRRLTEAHISWQLDAEISGEMISLREEAERLSRQVVGLKDVDQGTREVLSRVLSEVDDPFLLPAAWVHRDFAPWNLKQAPSGTLTAIDWESASPRGLPLYSLLHYLSKQAFLLKEKRLFPRSMKFLRRRYLEYYGIGPSMFRKLMLACLMQDWLRCHKKRHFQHASFLFQQLVEQLRNTE